MRDEEKILNKHFCIQWGHWLSLMMSLVRGNDVLGCTFRDTLAHVI